MVSVWPSWVKPTWPLTTWPPLGSGWLDGTTTSEGITGDGVVTVAVTVAVAEGGATDPRRAARKGKASSASIADNGRCASASVGLKLSANANAPPSGLRRRLAAPLRRMTPPPLARTISETGTIAPRVWFQISR